MKRCPKCETSKALDDFYPDKRAGDGRQGWCKKCQNAAPKKANTARIVRNRARHRATADLIERHAAEFDALYLHHYEAAHSEAAELAAEPAAAVHYVDTPVRLRPGARQPGEKAGDRIDVARCSHCVKHHDRNHVCPKCGAFPNHALTIPDDGDIDEIAVERAMKGDPVKLTTRERATALRLMAARGDNATTIATRLRMNGSRVNALLAEVRA